jgi:D-aminoacyl-tRNA deacylase
VRAVVQRVLDAKVEVENAVDGRIDAGLLIYLGVARDDGIDEVEWMADKVANLRIFEDEAGVMNRSVLGEGGAALVVSQFTLLADARKGRRPSYSEAAAPEEARRLYELFVDRLRGLVGRVETGVFQAAMRVSSTNDGPVTILLDSKRLF